MNKGRKITGGKYHALRKKKLYEKPGQERKVILNPEKRKLMRSHGGMNKATLLSAKEANVLVSPGKVKKTEIINVIETPQNKFMARQNRLMKGVIIETSLGKAKITNRPSQEGMINAVLIEKK